jgi:hypothetical protein
MKGRKETTGEKGMQTARDVDSKRYREDRVPKRRYMLVLLRIAGIDWL